MALGSTTVAIPWPLTAWASEMAAFILLVVVEVRELEPHGLVMGPEVLG